MSSSGSVQNAVVLADGLSVHLTAHEVGTWIGFLGSAFGVAMVVPQILRSLRNRRMGGVSSVAWTLGVISCTSWMLYGVRAHEAVQVPGDVLLVSGAIAIVLLIPAPVPAMLRGLGLSAAIAALCLAAAWTPASAIGVFATGVGLFSSVPQVIKSLRRPVGEPSAVSIPTAAMKVASQVCWFSFAALTGDRVVLLSSCFTQLCNVTILVTELRRSRPLAAAVEPAAEVVLVPA